MKYEDIPMSGIKPEDLRYDTRGVYIGPSYIVDDNPRALFARLLSKFHDDTYMNYIGDCMIRNNTEWDQRYVTIGHFCTIGGDGFGYEEGIKMPHLGNVKICDGVEIHSNVCIDRAVIGSTVIGKGTKIDNLVHIAHGAQIGENCLIVAGSVIGGSVVIGDHCFIGINASIKNKVKIGNNVTIGMGAVVTKDVPDGETWVGNPACKLLTKEEKEKLKSDFNNLYNKPNSTL